MCVKAIIDGVYCETASDLKAVGVTEIVRDSRYSIDGEDDVCLCWIDLEKTLTLAGLTAIRQEDGDWLAESTLTT